MHFYFDYFAHREEPVSVYADETLLRANWDGHAYTTKLPLDERPLFRRDGFSNLSEEEHELCKEVVSQFRARCSELRTCDLLNRARKCSERKRKQAEELMKQKVKLLAELRQAISNLAERDWQDFRLRVTSEWMSIKVAIDYNHPLEFEVSSIGKRAVIQSQDRTLCVHDVVETVLGMIERHIRPQEEDTGMTNELRLSGDQRLRRRRWGRTAREFRPR